MKFRKLSAVILALLTAASITFQPLSAGAQTDIDSDSTQTEKLHYVEGEAIVIFEDNKTADSIEKIVDVEDTAVIETDEGDISFACVSDNNSSTDEIIEKLEDNKNVRLVVPNTIKRISSITNDTYSDYQWAFNNNSFSGGQKGIDISPEKLWEYSEPQNNSCVVAVLDTGIDLYNEDLTPVMWTNTYDELPGKGKNGYDFTNTTYDHSPYDDNGHGSHVAGIIAAKGNNAKGISGVNRTGVQIMSLKICDDEGYLELENELKAYEYVAKAKKLGVNITAINCSYGGYDTEDSKLLYDEIFDNLGKLGIVSCVAAGNEENDIDAAIKMDEDYLYYDMDYIDINNPLYCLPAASDSEFCVTVGAHDESGKLASFSNYGKNKVDIAAPGTSILSTVSYTCFNPSIYSKDMISGICSYYQDYNDSLKSGEFGSLSKVNRLGYSDFSTKSQTAVSDYHFGQSGKSMKITMTEKLTYDSELDDYYPNVYAFKIPYTLSNTAQSYDISLMATASEMCGLYVCDFPENYSKYDIESIDDVPNTEVYLSEGSWDHVTLHIDTSSSLYVKNKSRFLLIQIYALSDKTSLYIDDLAISKQGTNSEKFGKYDFYSGTSMATPMVTGALALISNSLPDYSASELIDVMKDYANKSSRLSNSIENGAMLNLDFEIPTGTALYGDADGDGEISIIDATIIQKASAELLTLDTKQNDVDKDGSVTVNDSSLVQKYIADMFDTKLTGKHIR